MLVIRREQVEVFREQEQRRIERDLMVFLRRHHFQRATFLSEHELLELVRKAVHRAAGYGISLEDDLRAIVKVALDRGAEFDTDPALPWAPALLTEMGRSPSERAARLLAVSDELIRGKKPAKGS